MRIGILTFHHAFNYGAFLQAEGLHGKLEQLGHESEIIDYRNPTLEAVHERCIRYGWNPISKRASLNRRKRFIESLSWLRLSPKSIRPEDTDYSRYDAVVYGSDEIWNYTSHVHRFDPVFFGGPTPESLRRVAYAPSLGELKWEQAPPPAEISPLLSRFSNIAVRDINTAAFVERVTSKKPEVVVDPVMLYHNTQAIPDRHLKQPHLLVYGEIRDEAQILASKALAKKLGCRTVSVGYRNRWCDRVELAEGPHEFLGWLRSARAVITTTFHGTMFSIKFGKPFVTLRKPGHCFKFDPLISQLDLQNRILTDAGSLTAAWFDDLPDTVQTKLQDRVESSISYLSKALS